MQRIWEEDNAHGRFWRQLVRQRAEAHMQDAEYMRHLRYQNDRAKKDQKLFGHIWEEYGTNVYKLIAKACGETWDAEDDEKTGLGRFAEKKTAPIQQRETIDNDDVVTTCEEGPRRREHKLQGKPEASVRVVEEDKGCPESKKGQED